MAAPTAPTKSTIVSTALGDAGYGSDIPSALTTLAEGRWFSEIKNDIFHLVKDLKFLQQTSIAILTKGLSRYSYPSDFSHDLSMKILDGSETGTAQAGSSTSITLESGTTLQESDVQGKEILITGGTGVGSFSQITALNTSTLVATVSPAFNTDPDSTSTYRIIDKEYLVEQGPVWDFDKLTYPMALVLPTHFHPIGDEDYGEFIFNTAPDKAYGLRLRYYVDISLIDEDGTLHATLLRRWENIFYKGIYAKALKRDKDGDWGVAEQDYRGALQALNLRERYGAGLNNINESVSDYR